MKVEESVAERAHASAGLAARTRPRRRPLDRLLPATVLTGSADIRARARVLVAFMVLMIVTGLVIAVAAPALGAPGPALGGLAGVGGYAALLVHIRRGSPLSRSTLGASLVIFAVATQGALALGGIGSAPLHWYPVIVLFAVLVAGRTSGLLLALLAVLALSAFFFLPLVGVDLPHVDAAVARRIEFADGLVMTATVLALALAYERIKQHALSEVEAANHQLQLEIAEHLRTRQSLAAATRALVENAHNRGMAEIAAGILHNIGNALNHVNTSAALISEQVDALAIGGVEKVADELSERSLHDVSSAERNVLLARYGSALATTLKQQRATIAVEAASLRRALTEVASSVATHQHYVERDRRIEPVAPADVVAEVLDTQQATLARHNIAVDTHLCPVEPIATCRAQLVVIFANLLSNAIDAIVEAGIADGRITVHVEEPQAATVRIAVSDNGVGIAPRDLERVFQLGYTTKAHGHGYGLHSATLAARDLGGSLRCESAGPGMGATFALEIRQAPA